MHGGSRCEAHIVKAWSVRTTPTKRITGRKLQRMREELFRRDPLCAECRRQGMESVATQRDHIVALTDGGADDESNTQGLCDACHDAKSLAERLRGRPGGPSKG